MSVSIPNPMGIRIGAGGPPIAVAPLSVGISSLPKIQVGLDRLEVGLDKLQVGVDPLELSLRIKEIPSLRVHLPAHFELGLRIAGRELLCLRLCGEAQIITEPYKPNPAERCSTKAERMPGPLDYLPAPEFVPAQMEPVAKAAAVPAAPGNAAAETKEGQ